MKKILIVTLLMVLVFGSILAITGVIGAEEPIVITEEDFEMDCMAAPAVAGILLEEAGIDNRYGKGKDGGNYISDVARHMGPETDFNGVKKCDIIAYECVIAAYLNGLENFPGVTSQYTGILDPVASGATWEDNKDKTGTMYLTVLDKCGNSIEGLGLADIEVDITWVGLTDLFTLGAGGYWNIDLVDESDGNYEITFYRLGSVPYSRNWDIIIMDEVIEKSLYVTVTDVSAVLESVVYEGTCSLFGTHIGDKITFTFSNNVFHESNVEVTFQTAQRLWEGWGADDWTMDGNTATVTLKRLYSSPRDIIGDTVIDISGMVDALGNPVIIPSGGVEVDGIVTYPTVKQSGTFTSTRHLPGGWSYDIVIARDCDDSFISGTITLTDINGDVVEAVIKDLKYDYAYWSGDIPNIAAVGTTTYLGVNYYFMFLYAKRALWMGISTLDYQTAWDSGSVYSSGQRAYDIHSQNTYDFPIFW